ncbi:hypothetical protein DQ353_02810 [Arthrobacter sp. AQ5-05]|uniref:hypothetical protein n=1 Tax=Arthrobacter sp. AQ5-05 TaxID=2184581 RepID=UPI000DCDB160|nr:hypothetical protein [Arthrobacter sp. AQ5-05]RAX50506.1 hypothetical protein DQ353_02810 [Arthrobacter sp. AQ5-05]
MALAGEKAAYPMGTRGPRIRDDSYMVTLGLGVWLTLLISAGMLLAGFVLHTIWVTCISVPFFVVAFASARLFARLHWNCATRAPVMGAILGWAFLAPIWALATMAANAVAGVEDPEVFMPETWLWALVPLGAVLVVAGIRQRTNGRDFR